MASLLVYETIEFHQNSGGSIVEVDNAMLAEKYFLLLETLRSHAERSPVYADGAPKVTTISPHVPVQLPGASRK